MGPAVERNDPEGVHPALIEDHELVGCLQDLQRVGCASLARQPARLAGHIGIVFLQVLRPLGVNRAPLLVERHVDRLLDEPPVSHVHDPSVGPHAAKVRGPARKTRFGIDADAWFRRLKIHWRLRRRRTTETEKRDHGHRETPAVPSTHVTHFKVASRKLRS